MGNKTFDKKFNKRILTILIGIELMIKKVFIVPFITRVILSETIGLDAFRG